MAELKSNNTVLTQLIESGLGDNVSDKLKVLLSKPVMDILINLSNDDALVSQFLQNPLKTVFENPNSFLTSDSLSSLKKLFSDTELTPILSNFTGGRLSVNDFSSLGTIIDLVSKVMAPGGANNRDQITVQIAAQTLTFLGGKLIEYSKVPNSNDTGNGNNLQNISKLASESKAFLETLSDDINLLQPSYDVHRSNQSTNSLLDSLSISNIFNFIPNTVSGIPNAVLGVPSAVIDSGKMYASDRIGNAIGNKLKQKIDSSLHPPSDRESTAVRSGIDRRKGLQLGGEILKSIGQFLIDNPELGTDLANNIASVTLDISTAATSNQSSDERSIYVLKSISTRCSDIALKLDSNSDAQTKNMAPLFIALANVLSSDVVSIAVKSSNIMSDKTLADAQSFATDNLNRIIANSVNPRSPAPVTSTLTHHVTPVPVQDAEYSGSAMINSSLAAIAQAIEGGSLNERYNALISSSNKLIKGLS